MVRPRADVTGVLLVGGQSRRFGSPKALARLGGETLGERAHRLLHEAFAEVIAVGKSSDALPLPFPVLDDESEVRAPIVGVTAGLRHAGVGSCVIVPTDMPWLTARFLHALADAVAGADVAVPATGPLPGAYRQTALPFLERRIAAGELALHRALEGLEVHVVEADPDELRNVNTPADLRRGRRGSPDREA